MDTITPPTLEALQDLPATIRLWPDAGTLLGLGKDSTYRAAERGEIPTLRFGRRLVVPVPKLLALLGVDGEDA